MFAAPLKILRFFERNSSFVLPRISGIAACKLTSCNFCFEGKENEKKEMGMQSMHMLKILNACILIYSEEENKDVNL